MIKSKYKTMHTHIHTAHKSETCMSFHNEERILPRNGFNLPQNYITYAAYAIPSALAHNEYLV